MAGDRMPTKDEVIEHLEAQLEHQKTQTKYYIDLLNKVRSEKDFAYSERNHLVALLAKIFPASLEFDLDATGKEWGWVVIIDLPAGQASWHIHESELALFDHIKKLRGRKWDGHTTEEKYERVKRSISRFVYKGGFSPFPENT